MNKLKETKKLSPAELEKQSKALLSGAADKGTVDKNNPKAETLRVNSTIKINVLLPLADHAKFKAYCAISNTSIQTKGLEIIRAWLDEQPDIF